MSKSFEPTTRLVSVLFLLGALGLVGCGSMSGGETIIKYTRGEDPGPLISAPHTGSYSLYYTTDSTPQVRTPCRAGDKLGFRVEPGRVTAVAGDYQKVVPEGVYEAFWKYMKQ